jgi:hypothetical protein
MRFAGPFSPLSLSPILWLDGNDAGTMFDATSGGSPSAMDAVVKRWADKSGNGNNAIQGTSGKEPLRKSTGLQFDGTNDGLQISSITLASRFSLFAVGTFTTAKPLFIEQGTNASAFDGFYVYGSNLNCFVVRRTTLTTAAGTANWMGSARAIIELNSDDTNAFVAKNGTVPGSSTSALAAPAGDVSAALNIACRNQASVFGDGILHELIIINRTTTTTERTALRTFLAGKWSVTL